jgi:large subunit ribosomal protein L15
MKLNTLSPAEGARTERKRVGRGIGSGLGKTAGRGHKGSFARAGKGKIKAGFEGGQMPMKKRLPKVGFRSRIKNDTAEVMTYQLERMEAGEIDFAALRAAKLVPANAKQAKIVKKGDLSKKFVLKGLLATAGAKAAVEAGRRQPGGVRALGAVQFRRRLWAGSASSPSSASACCSCCWR